MDRYSDHLYRRSMGLAYDPDIVAKQVANGERAGSYDDDDVEDYTYSLDGSDLFIVPVSQQLVAVGSELDRLKHKRETGTLYARDIDHQIATDAQRISDSLHQQYEELAEEDKKYARAVQDWTISELKARHPDFVREQQHSTPEQMAEQLYETASIVGELLIELHDDSEDEKLIMLAETWHKELLADCMVAEFRQLYALAA